MQTWQVSVGCSFTTRVHCSWVVYIDLAVGVCYTCCCLPADAALAFQDRHANAQYC